MIVKKIRTEELCKLTVLLASTWTANRWSNVASLEGEKTVNKEKQESSKRVSSGRTSHRPLQPPKEIVYAYSLEGFLFKPACLRERLGAALIQYVEERLFIDTAGL